MLFLLDLQTAFPQEDAEAAGWCARCCEELHGAEAFAQADGLDAFIAVAMGQSLKEGNAESHPMGQGLMVALVQALMMEMSDFKVAIFETLCAAARWPSLKGRIAGSGVLGVITATLLSPKQNDTSKALMLRLCGQLASDSVEALQLKDSKRAEEFARLRSQLISSGAIKAIGEIFKGKEKQTGQIENSQTDSQSESRQLRSVTLQAAAAKAVSQLGGIAGDEAIRAELIAAEVVPAMLQQLQSFIERRQEDSGQKPRAATNNVEENQADEDKESDCEVFDLFEEGTAVEAILTSFLHLSAVDGCEELLAPLQERSSVNAISGILGVCQACSEGKAIVKALHCLRILGTKYKVWPETNEELARDLYRLLILRSETATAAAAFLNSLNSLLRDVSFFSKFGDVRPLRRALLELNDPAAASVIAAIDSLQSCQRCGIISSCQSCGKCRLVAYCSKECQRADWKLHKPGCH